MGWRTGIFVALLAVISAARASAQAPYSVEIDLEQQMAYLLRGRHLVLQSPISSGRSGHLTHPGSFRIVEKERNHFSTMYGKIVDRAGRAIVTDADADMKVPRGGRFVPAPMSYFMRFNGAEGMHAGYLPGYPASHGCVRMPERMATAFFNAVEPGTPVHVFGRTPLQRDYFRYGPQPVAPRYQRQMPLRLLPAAPLYEERLYDPRENDDWDE